MAFLGYACPVPVGECSGKVAKDVGPGQKFHLTASEILRCKENHLERRGFVKVDTRQWRDPKGGILVLARHLQRTSMMRKGKEGRAMREFHMVIEW